MEKNCFCSVESTKSRTAVCTIEICKATTIDCSAFERRERFRQLCEDGCKNYGCKWSCPPFSPSFSSVAAHWTSIYLIYIRIPLSAFTDIKNDYLKVKAANSMIKSRADKFMQALAKEKGKYITTGSCRLCKPCRKQKGEPCAHPATMAYSLEALGLDVDHLVRTYFSKPLLWYKKGHIPEYTSVVCGLLTNESVSLELMKNCYFQTTSGQEYPLISGE